MTLHAWRIIKAKNVATAFSGSGAKTYGGRWNSVGTGVIYAAGSASLAILEMLVHLQAPEFMRRFVIFKLTFDESLVTAMAPANLPKSWQRSPAPASAQAIGDNWVSIGTSAILRLPSAIVPTEHNYLLNPSHRDFAKIGIATAEPIKFDPRLVKAPTP